MSTSQSSPTQIEEKDSQTDTKKKSRNLGPLRPQIGSRAKRSSVTKTVEQTSPSMSESWETITNTSNRIYTRQWLLEQRSSPSVLPDADVIANMKNIGIWEDDATVKDNRRPKPRESHVRVVKQPRKDETGEAKPRPSKNKDKKELFYGTIQRLLNKLTYEKFEYLTNEMGLLLQTIQDSETLSETVKKVHRKALSEPQFSSMYSELCKILEEKCPTFPDENRDKPLSFKKLILNECHKAFEESPGIKPDPDSDEYEVYLRKRDRNIGNIVFMSELFKKDFFPILIIDRCIKQLIGSVETILVMPRPIDPDILSKCEFDCEKLFNLISKCGKDFEKRKKESGESIDEYIEKLKDFASNKLITSRVRFLIREVVDTRENDWVPRRTEEGPKRIDQVHEQFEMDTSTIQNIQHRVTIPTSEYENRANKIEKERIESESNGTS